MGNAVRNFNQNVRFQDISGSLTLAAADNDQTLVTNPSAYYSIFIQKIRAYVITDAAQSATFEDSAGTPVKIASVPTSPGAGTFYDRDYGPMGVQLTEGKNFVINVTAPGLALKLEWEGYMRPTAASRPASAL